jgi:hypothetical protein
MMPEAEHLLISYATLLVIAFLVITTTFLAVGLRVSAALQAFVGSQLQQAKTAEKVADLCQEFLDQQRNTHEQMWLAIQVQADRLNRFLEKTQSEGL